MLGLRKLCVKIKQCCFNLDPSSNEVPDLKSPHSNETVMTLAKSSGSLRRGEEIPTLTLTIIETSQMILGEKYQITPSGLSNSNRKSRDNCVYAGNTKYQGSSILNDIVLSKDENGTGKKHFMIKYQKGNTHSDSQRYLIKDMGEGLGTFIRLDRPFKIQNGNIFSFGDSHMIVNLDSSFVTLRFIQGPKTDYKTYPLISTYSIEDSPIKVGRMHDCDVRFEDGSLSRYHCFLYFEGFWVIQDGDGKKSSMNGTWLFVEQFTEIYDETVFKAGETLFKCSFGNEYLCNS